MTGCFFYETTIRRRLLNKLIFVSCCGSGYAVKDEKFGHGLVFEEVRKLMGDRCIQCQAFPIDLVLSKELKKDPNVVMNTHIDDVNFKGEIKERFEAFIQNLMQAKSQPA